MPLVWVTGNAGAGKSTVCALLKARGELAVDADGEIAFFCGCPENAGDVADLFDFVICLVVAAADRIPSRISRDQRRTSRD